MEMDINENIKKYRKIKKITQSELGRMINKSLRMIQKYESGEVVPSLDVITDIAKALDINKWDLVEDKRTSEEILGEVKNLMDNTNFIKAYPLNDNELLTRFRILLINIGVIRLDSLNSQETSDQVLLSVLFSDEFKRHTKYLIDTEIQKNKN